jgi:toxin ParE1/3/4
MLTIVWSSKALNDLDEIVAYIGARNRTAALNLADRIEESVIPAAQFPYQFRAGRLNGTREIVAHPNYIVIYRVQKNHVVVTAVIHAMRRYP